MGIQKPLQQPVSWPKEIGLFLLLNLIWLLLALLAAWLGWRSYRLSTQGIVAPGQVVKLLQDETAFDSDFSPVVEFQVNGKAYTVQSQNNYRWWDRYLRFPVGKQVEMRYDPHNPASAEINSWLDLWFEPLVLGLFTAIVALGVNGFLVFRWRHLRKKQAPA